MSDEQQSIQALLVIGNTAQDSSTRRVVNHLGELLRTYQVSVDLFDCASEDLPLFNVETVFKTEGYAKLKERLVAADVLVLGTPDYHGSMSSATKNFLDHFWKEFAGKLFASIVGSYEKGLTVHDQIRTVARQCYAWSLPYGVSFHEKADFGDDQSLVDSLNERLVMMAADLARYGKLLATQKKTDLASDEPGFLAHYRS